ncbi:MAG: DUF1330 domain-containing protein [Deltaproteobacteria bacterium]|nr:DUF1330 domain-containing protein [Deltaproteobacteria bacterium]
MDVENRLYPDAEQIAVLQQPGPDGPIVMVNLLKFRARAQYKDGRDAHLSGRDAYLRYSVLVAELLKQHGGRVVYAGDVTGLAIGQVASMWDEIALAEYPNRAALLAMSTSAEWIAASEHRSAGLEGQLNIETVPAMAAILGGAR